MFYWKLNIDFIKFIFCFLMKPLRQNQCTVIQNGPYLVDFPWTQTVCSPCLVSPCPGYSYFIDVLVFSKASSTLVHYPFSSKTETTPVISIQLASSDWISTAWKCLLEWIWRLQVSAYPWFVCCYRNLFLFILIDINLQGSWRP